MTSDDKRRWLKDHGTIVLHMDKNGDTRATWVRKSLWIEKTAATPTEAMDILYAILKEMLYDAVCVDLSSQL